MSQNGNLPQIGVKIQNILKPPPSNGTPKKKSFFFIGGSTGFFQGFERLVNPWKGLMVFGTKIRRIVGL